MLTSQIRAGRSLSAPRNEPHHYLGNQRTRSIYVAKASSSAPADFVSSSLGRDSVEPTSAAETAATTSLVEFSADMAGSPVSFGFGFARGRSSEPSLNSITLPSLMSQRRSDARASFRDSA